MDTIWQGKNPDGLLERVRIEQDTSADNPQEAWDMLSEIVLFNDRASYREHAGLKHTKGDVWLEQYDYQVWNRTYQEWEDYEYQYQALEYMVRENKNVVIPLWDNLSAERTLKRLTPNDFSGCIGFAVITRAKALKEYGGERLTAKTREKAENLILAEIGEIRAWVEGEVYYFIRETLDTETGKWDMVDSVCGFYGEYEPETIQGYMPNYITLE